MGFTIDMGSGELVDESSTQVLSPQGMAPKVREDSAYHSEFESIEPALSIVEQPYEEVSNVCIPEVVAQLNVDTFVDKFS